MSSIRPGKQVVAGTRSSKKSASMGGGGLSTGGIGIGPGGSSIGAGCRGSGRTGGFPGGFGFPGCPPMLNSMAVLVFAITLPCQLGLPSPRHAQQTVPIRSVPVRTLSASRPPHPEQTSRSRQSRTGVSARYRAAISAGSGSTWWLHTLHHTISRTRAAAASSSVICDPGGDFISFAI